ncbi:GspE/PulE family protein [bacterium]|nr:GspE/PulE family protein [bacterium]
MPQKHKEEIKVDIIKLVNDIFYQGIAEGASDVHFEPLGNEGLMVRFRVDGIMRVVFEGDKILFGFMASRLKIMADLEITGLPRPQEGNIKFKYEDDHIDLRVSFFPTNRGECCVVRILETSKHFGDFRNLGFTDDQTHEVEKIVKKPHGLLLVTGPNGSGKSTTLFSILNGLNEPGRCLVTLEDPVERKIERVRQTKIDLDVGLTFAAGLRFLLRQDPDVIMVGEIRDKETAEIAVQAAVTGHLVLATIHTNNAAGAIVRLINMGIEPFLLSSALKFISAQRLARMNCPDCRKEYEPPKELLDILGAPKGIKFYHSEGCEKCNYRGTQGREGIHEVLPVSKAIKKLILNKPSDEEVNKVAIEDGMMTLRLAALQKVYDGTISIEEAIRLTE